LEHGEKDAWETKGKMVWKKIKVKAKGHTAEVLKILKNLIKE